MPQLQNLDDMLNDIMNVSPTLTNITIFYHVAGSKAHKELELIFTRNKVLLRDITEDGSPIVA